MVSRRSVSEDQWSTALSLARRRSAGSCYRYSGATQTGLVCRSAILPEAVTEQSASASRDHYGQAPQLRRCEQSCSAASGSSAESVSQQSSGELASADPATGAPDEAFQVARACAAFPRSARYCGGSLPTETT